MRTYHDKFYWAVLPVKLDASTAAREGKQRLAEMYRQACWRLNESEAIVHAAFFEAHWQPLLPNYGERRCFGSDDFEYWHGWSSSTPWTVHHGRPYSERQCGR